MTLHYSLCPLCGHHPSQDGGPCEACVIMMDEILVKNLEKLFGRPTVEFPTLTSAGVSLRDGVPGLATEERSRRFMARGEHGNWNVSLGHHRGFNWTGLN